eukprot:COSAG02_NODE_4393_length_5412_cov_10.835057_1_plen_896_part_00
MLMLLPQCAAAALLAWSAPEPFAPLHGVNETALPAQPDADDPLVRFVWSAQTNDSALQVYRTRAVSAVSATPETSFSGTSSLLTGGAVGVTVRGTGALRLDFGVERAGWFEFESPDLGAAAAASVSACVSEFNHPWPGKTKPVKAYGTTYRLETNPELYEGVRFAWIFFEPSSSDDTVVPAWRITNVSVVAKVKPVRYTGSFASSDDVLTKVWYSGAYGVRLNMEAHGFNSVLMDRGDRVSIQGDGHPTMAAGLVAFSPYKLVLSMLQQTNSGSVNGHKVVDASIMSYPLYWTMSVNDYYWASGDKAGFLALVPDMRSIIDARVADFLQQPHIEWMGWDDRLGNGFCGVDCGPDGQLAFAPLVVRSAADLGRSLKHAGEDALAANYTATVTQLAARLRQLEPAGGGAWHANFGLHAAANAINAGVPTRAETEVMFSREFNDSTVACSFSPFNQYWNLQAYSNAGMMDYALASVRLCWGSNLKLGRGCFWEIYSPEWVSFMQPGDKAPTMPSYCHPWASGVTAWLTHAVGGLQPSRPGFASYTASPYLGDHRGRDGASSVNVSVMTYTGEPITMSGWRSMDGRVATIRISAPVAGMVGVRRGYPECQLVPSSVHVDGTATPMSALASSEVGLLHDFEHPRFVWSALSRGQHVIQARYRCALPTPVAHAVVTPDRHAPPSRPAGIEHYMPFPQPQYKARSSPMLDKDTQGTWIGKYGSKGYVLFGFDVAADNETAMGIDRVKMPPSVSSVTLTQHGFRGTLSMPRIRVGPSQTNASFLQDPANPSGARSLGYPAAIGMGQGILLKINSSAGIPLNVSVYAVGTNESAQAIRPMDLRSFKLIAPEPHFADFQMGAWWTLTYTPPLQQQTGAYSGDHNNGVCLRVMGIYGMTISAVAFD